MNAPMEHLGRTFSNMQPTLSSSDLLDLPDESDCPNCGETKLEFQPMVRQIAANRGIPYRGGLARYCQCADHSETARRAALAFANLPAHATGPDTFLNFHQREGTQQAYDAAWQFSQHRGPAMLTIYSREPGTGKTHLLEAIGRELVNRKQSVRYEYAPDLLYQVRQSYGERPQGGHAPNPLEAAEMAGTLLLDDLGLEKTSDWTSETLTRLVDNRYRTGRRLAVATNRTLEEFKRRGDFRLGDRLYDIGSGLVMPVAITALSYRTEWQF